MELWEHQGGRCALTGVAMTWVAMPIAEVRAGHLGLRTMDRMESIPSCGHNGGVSNQPTKRQNHSVIFDLVLARIAKALPSEPGEDPTNPAHPAVTEAKSSVNQAQ